MHELSLCESVLEILQNQARSQGFSKVKRVWLEVGALSCVEPEAMRLGFDSVMKGTLADGATLELIRVPGVARCSVCLQNVEVQQYGDLCPECGAAQLDVMDGDQLRVKELEVL